ncbi:MAG TPA: SDR family NAD(P)-dependent oxidoreductase, partial [Candidatus Binataceae bacterium]
MSRALEGKGIIVTGATRGIGRAIALELARQGANIAFNYAKNAELAATLEEELKAAGATVLPFQTDVADLKGAREMVAAAKGAFGKIDGLVNNAGITRDKLLAMMSE